MKIYTKSGDRGETGLFAGPRVWKDDPRMEACGTVDELNALLGLARSDLQSGEIDQQLNQIQHDLFAVGAELATPDPHKHGTDFIGAAHIASLERAIDDFESRLPRLTQFILPGGARSAAVLHVARAVCRRAERRLVTLFRSVENVAQSSAIIYLNRLGDLLFVLARAANQHAGHGDVVWQKPT